MMRAASNNLNGWVFDGKRVHPPEAYTRMEYWLNDFEAAFPDKAKRMHVYSDRQGWAPTAHLRYWPRAIINFLNRVSSGAGSNHE